MREAMSFGRAWLELEGPRYEKMRDESGYSPLHLVPLDDSGRPRLDRLERVVVEN